MMKMTGVFHLTLLPAIDATKFEKQITEVAFANVTFQLTRTTKSFEHRLLKQRGVASNYLWMVDVDLMTTHDYDFDANLPKVQDALQHMAVVTAVHAFEHVG